MTTFYDTLLTVRQAILDKHNFFSEGYAYAKLHDTKGLVATNDKNMEYVGISDNKGNYFYIRIPDRVPISPNVQGRTSDCGRAITQNMPCVLVSVTRDVNEFAVSDSIINMLLSVPYINPTALTLDYEAIVRSEFKGLNEQAQNSVISKLKNMDLVKIEFTIAREFHKSNCVFNFCKPC